jgi:hypothetical protein
VTEAAAALAAAGAQAQQAPPAPAVLTGTPAAAPPADAAEAVEVMALEVPSDPDQLAQWSEDLAALCQALDSTTPPRTTSHAFPPPARPVPQ